MRSVVLMVLGALAGSVPGSAQMSGHRPAPSVLFGYGQVGPLQTDVPAAAPDTLQEQIRPTYWKEGAWIGGVLGALGGAVLGHRLCGLAEESTRHCTGSLVLGGVLGAALLAIPGALVGGQFSKQAPEPEGAESGRESPGRVQRSSKCRYEFSGPHRPRGVTTAPC